MGWAHARMAQRPARTADGFSKLGCALSSRWSSRFTAPSGTPASAQGASCALVVGPSVYAGVPLEPLIFNAMLEPPSVPTTKHARQYATNVPPVRARPPRKSSAAALLAAAGLRELEVPCLVTRLMTVECHHLSAAQPAASVQGSHTMTMPTHWSADSLARRLQDAAPAAATGAPRAEGFDLDLAACATAWLTDSTLLLSTQSGQLVFVHLHADGGIVKRLRVRASLLTVPGSCALERPAHGACPFKAPKRHRVCTRAFNALSGAAGVQRGLRVPARRHVPPGCRPALHGLLGRGLPAHPDRARGAALRVLSTDAARPLGRKCLSVPALLRLLCLRMRPTAGREKSAGHRLSHARLHRALFWRCRRLAPRRARRMLLWRAMMRARR